MKTQCQATIILQDKSQRQCLRAGVRGRSFFGRHYCYQHSPEAMARRAAARKARLAVSK